MKLRMTRRSAAIIIALMMIAVPAAAAVVTQNFMAADLELNAACFTKEAGTDVLNVSGYVAFNGAETIDGGGVSLLQETVGLEGFAGDRLIYSDAVHIRNSCGHALDVTLIGENDAFGGAVLEPSVPALVWQDMDVAIYMSNELPGDVTTLPPSSQWVLMLTVVDGTVTSTNSQVAMANTAVRSLAFVVDTDATIDSTPPPAGEPWGTIRWTAQATHP
jgi:hypothetical protein